MEHTRFSRYRIVERIGSGGMGVVYRAHDERLWRDVAIKVLRPGLLSDDAARQRFRKEALALSQLNHPNIAVIHDFDSQDGVDFLVMECIEGPTLQERLAAGRLSEREQLALALQLAEALAAAHARGVIHRDVKPANLRITPEGRLKVLDFGLARMLEPRGRPGLSLSMTEAGGAAGTLAYMAPEVLSGESPDARSDIYACGVVLYEMATGQRPFAGETAVALIYAVLHQQPRSPRLLAPAIAPELERLILRALDPQPAQRPASGRELLAELRALVDRPAPGAAVANPAAAPGDRIESLAVLPLENLSGDPAQEYFADGMTEALIADIAKLGALRVISRTSAMRFKGVRKSLPEIARELKVDVMVEGTVVRSGDRVRITAQLIDARTDTHLWAENYDRAMSDILALQSEVARAIAGEVRIKLTQSAQAHLARERRVDPAAYEAYLKGRYCWNRRGEDDMRRAVEYFKVAIEKDPGYALAYVGLADVYNLQGFYTAVAPAETFPRARDMALRALDIDPTLGEAHNSLDYVALYHGWDWAESERSSAARSTSIPTTPSHTSGT